MSSFTIRAIFLPFSVDSNTELFCSLPSELSLWYMGLSVRSERGWRSCEKSKIFPHAPVTHPFPRSLLQSGIVLLMRSFKLFHVNEESLQTPRDLSGMDRHFAGTSAFLPPVGPGAPLCHKPFILSAIGHFRASVLFPCSFFFFF